MDEFEILTRQYLTKGTHSNSSELVRLRAKNEYYLAALELTNVDIARARQRIEVLRRKMEESI